MISKHRHPVFFSTLGHFGTDEAQHRGVHRRQEGSVDMNESANNMLSRNNIAVEETALITKEVSNPKSCKTKKQTSRQQRESQ